MESKLIRQKFLDFFASKGHTIVPSAPMVIKDDPTLMFNNAGMNPFKDLFLGNSPITEPRIADTQKCLRVSGKHNDLEEVGVDTYHHTMFEMLGNWSFGDYFKAEAISWAWELLTEVYNLPEDRLYVTVFEGDHTDGLPMDEEAKSLWAKRIRPEAILNGNKKDNFWEMGETGPCGPCSEVHIDLRSDADRLAVAGADLVNADHPQVVEIWNLVFMQFNRMADGSLQPLPAQHIDTGMGFERLAMALQGVTSNYDTDIFRPTLEKIAALSGKTYGRSDAKPDVAFRVIADHIRAVSFSIADGQLPANTGAGYVIRRILRRAIRYGYSFLGLDEPFMHTLVPVLAEHMGEAFPELRKQEELITKVIVEEEESFLRTLAKGIELLETKLGRLAPGAALPGPDAFELYDTFGFPLDLTSLMASEAGHAIDETGFNAALAEQKERSRAAGKVSADDWIEVVPETAPPAFVGYDALHAPVRILRYRAVTSKKKTSYQLVFDQTPFYPEGGGQIGDAGTLSSPSETLAIYDTKRENNLIVHFSANAPKSPEATFAATVDATRRQNTARNHTATHLLHAALREILGTHVEQKGSLVKGESLRFDFSHFSRMTSDEIAAIEAHVNAAIRDNLPLHESRDLAIEEARAAGALMLFGEKYGDKVRMIAFGESKELCGGTHVPATGAIGSFRIVSESAVAAGIRRIEAITGAAAWEAEQADRAVLASLQEQLKGAKDMTAAVTALQASQAQLTKEVEAFRKAHAQSLKTELISGLRQLNGVNFIARELPLGASEIKDIAFQLKAEHAPFLGIFGSQSDDGKATISIAISDDLVKERGMNAGAMVRDLAKDISGGGGGQAFFATAGGKNAAGLAAALSRSESLCR